ncbi:helix-turn-helix transcriptional regulator [Pleomorphomonas koreensis]|uniref:helix-turn-helix transcriptional regulator n=1 Tax=Pleomorphomonas koreensis TaxID=257440 RepID=UPI0004133F62|nr:AraC family transcriptional regulator [Pleomorphomonas koreensis]
MLREVGLPVDDFDHARRIISCQKFTRLLDNTAVALGIPDFTIDFFRQAPPHLPNCGPLTLIGLLVGSIGEWADFGARYWNAHCNAFTVRLFDVAGRPDLLAVRFVCAAGYQRTTQMVEGVLASVVGATRHISRRPDLDPARLRFRHPRPADTASHAAVFRCELEFGADRDEIWIDRSLLSVETGGSLRLLRPIFEKFLRAEIARLPVYDQTMRGTTRAALESTLGSGRCTIDFIANSLGMSGKKLQRLLSADGTSFSAVLAEVRRDRAMRMLRETDIMVADVARLLDYAVVGAFTNAFTRWTGVSPTLYRRQSQDAPAG